MGMDEDFRDNDISIYRNVDIGMGVMGAMGMDGNYGDGWGGTKKRGNLGRFPLFYGKGWNYSARRVKRLKSTTVRSLSTDLR